MMKSAEFVRFWRWFIKGGLNFCQESKEMWAKVENGELTTEDVRRIVSVKLE